MTEQHPPLDREDRPSALPILIAIGVAVVVLAIVAITQLRGVDDLTPNQLVTRAAVGQNDALQRENYGDFAKYTCAAQRGVEAEVLAGQKKSVSVNGARYVDEVTGISVNGDDAAATVVYHFENSADNKVKTPMTFVRQDGDWKVCSPGPR